MKLEEANNHNYCGVQKEIGTIAESLNLDLLIPEIRSISYCFSKPKDYPSVRGNWILEIRTKNNKIHCLTFQKEINEEQFVKYIKPLLIRLRRKKEIE